MEEAVADIDWSKTKVVEGTVEELVTDMTGASGDEQTNSTETADEVVDQQPPEAETLLATILSHIQLFSTDKTTHGEAFVQDLTAYSTLLPRPPFGQIAATLLKPCGAEMLDFASWDIIGIIYEYLADPAFSDDVDRAATAGLLEAMARDGSPRDLLIPVSQWVVQAPLETWVHFVPALKQLIIRTEPVVRQAKSFRSSFSVVAGLLTRPDPTQRGSFSQADEEAKSAWTTQQIKDVYAHLLDFAKPFRDAWISQSTKVQEQQEALAAEIMRRSLVRFYVSMLSLHLLDVPLGDEYLRAIVVEVMTSLKQLKADLTELFTHSHRREHSKHAKRAMVLDAESSDDDSDDDAPELDEEGRVKDPKYTAGSVAVFAYFLLATDVCDDSGVRLPAALSPTYILRCGDTLVRALLACTKTVYRHVGLRLLSSLTSRVSHRTLNAPTLEEMFLSGPSAGRPIFQVIVEFVLHCPDGAIRQEGVSTLREFFEIFNAEGRHTLYATMLRECPFAQLSYLLILWVKQEVVDAIKSSEDGAQKHFLSSGLFQLLGVAMGKSDDKAFKAKNVLAEHDQLMALANFLRFLLLFGGPSIADSVRTNDIGIWNKSVLDDMEQRFLHPLSKKVAADTEALQARVEQADEGPTDGSEDSGHSHTEEGHVLSVDMDVSGAVTSKATLQQQLFKLQLLSGVLVRIEEVIAEGRDELE